MLARGILVLAVLALLLVACGGNAPGQPSTSTAQSAKPLDCGKDRKGSKAAVRQLFAVLRSGDEERVLDALATGGRFEWLSVYDKSGKAIVSGRANRKAAAAAVADFGGLPLRATDFQNIDKPSRTMDYGFSGTWGGRKMGGKGAIDCSQGRSRVLSIALPFNVR
jgi:hypothetical protein